MNNKVRAFITHKIDDEYSCCEDRLNVSLENNCFCISDGAGSSFYSAYFAELISSYQGENNVALSENDVKKIQYRWASYLEQQIKDGTLDHKNKARYERGEFAGATYVRLLFRKEERWLWDAAALGDSTLVYLKSSSKPSKVLLSGTSFYEHNFNYYYDIDGAKVVENYSFGKTPVGLKSIGECKSLEFQATLERQCIDNGDTFLLMTDALSDWVLNDPLTIESKICELCNLENQADFELYIGKLREIYKINNQGQKVRVIENDDITLIIIDIKNINITSLFSKEDSMITDINNFLLEEKKIYQEKLNSKKEKQLAILNQRLTDRGILLNKTEFNIKAKEISLNQKENYLNTKEGNLNKLAEELKAKKETGINLDEEENSKKVVTNKESSNLNSEDMTIHSEKINDKQNKLLPEMQKNNESSAFFFKVIHDFKEKLAPTILMFCLLGCIIVLVFIILFFKLHIK